MPTRLASLNESCKQNRLAWRNDYFAAERYLWRMNPRHDWYLKEWLAATRKRQSDVCRDLDWNKARVSLMLRGLQPYDRDSLNDLADYLNIRPHELLMHPSDAMALRALRANAVRIASIVEADGEEDRKKVSSV